MKIIAKHPFISMAIANIALGANSTILKLGYETVPPLLFGSMRYLIGGFFFITIAYAQPIKHTKMFLKGVSINSLIMIAVAVSWMLGVYYSTAINMALFGLLSPILVYIGSVVLLCEPYSIRALSGSLIALLGGLILFSAPLLSGDEQLDSNLLGNALLLTGVFSISGLILHTKKLYKYATVEQINGFRQLIAGLAIFALFVAGGSSYDFNEFTTSSLFYLMLSGVVTGSIAIYIFYTALKNMRAEDSSSLFYIDALSGIVFSSIVLGERLSDFALIGAAVIVFGVLVAHPRQHHRYHHHLSPVRHKFEEFFAWLSSEFESFEKAVKKII